MSIVFPLDVLGKPWLTDGDLFGVTIVDGPGGALSRYAQDHGYQSEAEKWDEPPDGRTYQLPERYRR